MEIDSWEYMRVKYECEEFSDHHIFMKRNDRATKFYIQLPDRSTDKHPRICRKSQNKKWERKL